MSTEQAGPETISIPVATTDARPYIIKTYDRWIILALVLVCGWLIFRPLFAFSVYYRGVSFEHTLHFGTAEHYYRKAISVDKNIPEGWLGLGLLQMFSARSEPGMYQTAIDTFSDGLAFNPKSGALAFDLCRTYYEIGHNYPKALEACQRGFQNDPTNHFAWDYAAWASLRLGKRDQALTYWREALRHGHFEARRMIERYSKNG